MTQILKTLQEKLSHIDGVNHVVCHDITESTNADALRLASGSAPHFSVVLAYDQQAGRGRHKRNWDMSPGRSLTFSILLRPSLPIEDWGHYSLLTGLAVCEGIRKYVLSLADIDPVKAESIGLKWPNDILLEQKKVSGILLESSVEHKALVAGIGINLDFRGIEISEEYAHKTTSIAQFLDRNIAIEEVLSSVIETFVSLYDSIGDDPSAVISRVRDVCVTIGQHVVAHTNNDNNDDISGIAIGLNGQGHLLIMPDTVNSNDNKPIVVQAADVEHLR